MSEREALLDAILRNPADDTVRLVYADKLQEDGEEARAEFIRVQIEQFNRGFFGPLTYQSVALAVPNLSTLPLPLQRSVTLLHEHGADWVDDPFILVAPEHVRQWGWRRGFLEQIICTMTDWLNHAGAICKKHPIMSVGITDREPNWPTHHVVGFTWMPTPEDDPFEHAQHVREGEQWSPQRPPHCLPWPIFYFVEGARKNNIATGVDDCRECLNRGCVIYGRDKAGLRG